MADQSRWQENRKTWVSLVREALLPHLFQFEASELATWSLTHSAGCDWRYVLSCEPSYSWYLRIVIDQSYMTCDSDLASFVRRMVSSCFSCSGPLVTEQLTWDEPPQLQAAVLVVLEIYACEARAAQLA